MVGMAFKHSQCQTSKVIIQDNVCTGDIELETSIYESSNTWILISLFLKTGNGHGIEFSKQPEEPNHEW